MDTVLSRLQVQHAQPHRRDSMPQAPRALPVNTRPMYSAVCADCGSKCEVPFKPSAGRSVYCKGCYSARRNNGSSAPRADMRSKEAVPTPAFNAPVAAKKKPAAKKAKKKA
jgi:CxxC-x17-CxxC domain-containing protein